MHGRDHVDWISDQWLREHPGIDVVPLATWGRLKRSAALFDRMVAAGVKPFKLRLGEFEVLAALRRSGPPFQMNPTDLGDALIVSAGTVTNRIARLERKGLVVRLRQPDDGRGVLVTMTESGRETFDAAFETLIELLAGVVGPIEGDQQQLAEILRRLLLPFGERAGLLPAPRELRSPPHRTPV